MEVYKFDYIPNYALTMCGCIWVVSAQLDLECLFIGFILIYIQGLWFRKVSVFIGYLEAASFLLRGCFFFMFWIGIRKEGL